MTYSRHIVPPNASFDHCTGDFLPVFLIFSVPSFPWSLLDSESCGLLCLCRTHAIVREARIKKRNRRLRGGQDQVMAHFVAPVSDLLSMPHPIVQIGELTQLVADLLLFDSPKSLTSLACTCRALEEQALSTLWSDQSSLKILVKSTIPSATLFPLRSPPQVRSRGCYWAHF